MKRSRRCAPAIAVLVLAAFRAPARAENDLAKKPEVAAAIQVLDVWIDRRVRDREQPGLSIGILYDQDLIWAKGYGFADLSRKILATPATAYRIASLSKLFTATALLQLRDQGKLQLDDPVAKYVPWFRFKNDRKDSPVITIRHLLTHTSGIPREMTGTYWNDMKFPTREQFEKALAEEETILPTETEWKYSNVALSIAGYVVEKVSGEPYAIYIEKRILRPLDMSHTRVLPTPDLPALAVGYGRRVPGRPRRVEPFLDSAYMTPAANLASTVEDLAKFGQLQFRDGPAAGPQVVNGSTLKEMQRVHWLQADWKGGWGLGWGVRRVGEQARISPQWGRPRTPHVDRHRPGGEVRRHRPDQCGGWRTRPLREPGLRNRGSRRCQGNCQTAGERGGGVSWSKYVGRYEWEDEEIQVMVLNGELAIVNPRDDNPWEERIKLEPVSPNVFRMKGGSQSGELIRFETDAAGNVTRMVEAGGYMMRVKEKS